MEELKPQVKAAFGFQPAVFNQHPGTVSAVQVASCGKCAKAWTCSCNGVGSGSNKIVLNFNTHFRRAGQFAYVDHMHCIAILCSCIPLIQNQIL